MTTAETRRRQARRRDAEHRARWDGLQRQAAEAAETIVRAVADDTGLPVPEVRKTLARGWNEGYTAGHEDGNTWTTGTPNPFQEGV